MEERERQGVTIDVCGRCRGVFLDRGELEKLIALAEPYDAPRRRNDDDFRREDSDERRFDRGHADDRGYQKGHRRKGGFLDVLGDIFD
jgi:Zn-finger nucleic acid-binding protein